MSDLERAQRLISGQDPETLIGPILLMLTWRADADDPRLVASLRDHLLALSLHPAISCDLRLCAGALAMEPVCVRRQ